MKYRVLKAINKELEKNPDSDFLKKQKKLINTANISTLHSFCYKLIKEHFYKLGIKSNIQISSDEDVILLREEILNDILEEKYENGDEGFDNLIDKYATFKDDDELKRIINNISYFLESIPFRKKWQTEVLLELKNLEEEKISFEDTKSGKYLINLIESKIIYYIDLYNKALNDVSMLGEEYIDYIERLKNERDILSYIKDEFLKEKNLGNVINKLINFNSSKEKWPSSRKLKCLETDVANNFRKVVKEDIDIVSELIPANSMKELIEDYKYSYEIIHELFNIIDEFFARYEEKKRELNILDYSDLEHLSIKLLYDEIKKENGEIEYEISDIAKELRRSFKEVQVDEYQDTNLVQEKIINAIADKNLFQVGDVKQSIYKFRNAKPELFMNKYNSYSDISEGEYDEVLDGKLIRFDKNFRSKKNVLDFCNDIFKIIMVEGTGRINYTEKEYLNLGRDENAEDLEDVEILYAIPEYEKGEHYNDIKENLEINKEISEYNNVEKEAIMIAKKIEDIKENYISRGKKFSYGDIAILLRSVKENAEIYKNILLQNNIPAMADTGEGFFNVYEIELVFSYIKIINNPLIDIDLLAVMRSYFGDFDMEELTKIRILNIKDSYYESCLDYINTNAFIDDMETKAIKDKLINFFEKIEYYREMEKKEGISRVFDNIIYDTGYYNYLALDKSTAYITKLLDELVKKVEEIEKNKNLTLKTFISYIDKLKEAKVDMQSDLNTAEENEAVKIMSIHKSKGLEFPIVVLAKTEKGRNIKSQTDEILLDSEFGIGINIINKQIGYKYPNIYKNAIKEKIKLEDIEEEMRVLYVALTRAKEKLIISGVDKELEENIEKLKEHTLNFSDRNREYLKIWPSKILDMKKYFEYVMLGILATFGEEKIKIDKFDIDGYIYKSLNNFESQKHKEDVLKSAKKYVYNEDYIDFGIEELVKEKIEKIKEVEKIEQEEKLINKKLSVSNLTTRIKEEGINEEKIKEYNNENELELPLSLEENMDTKIIESDLIKVDLPEFMKKENITGKILGNIYHSIFEMLEVMDKEKYKIFKEKTYTEKLDYIKGFLDNIIKNNVYSEKELEKISKNKILKFMDSEMYGLMVKANENNNVFKEKSFYQIISEEDVKNLNEIYPKLNIKHLKINNSKVILQGIIDLYFILNDTVYIVDYKTDFVTNKETLINRYNEQIGLYAYALKQGLSNLEKSNNINYKIKRYLYSVHLGEFIKLENYAKN